MTKSIFVDMITNGSQSAAELLSTVGNLLEELKFPRRYRPSGMQG